MKKLQKICFLLALFCLVFTGCKKTVQVTTPMGTFALDGYRTTAEYAYARPGAGSEVLVLYLAGDESVNWDQTRLYSYFCKEKPAKVAPENGAAVSAEGITMEMNEESGAYRCAVLFEVPQTESKKWTVTWPDGTETEIRI